MRRKIFVLAFLFLVSNMMAQSGGPVLRVSTMSVSKDYQTELIVEILTEAYRRVGAQLIVEYYPIRRSLSVANSGEVDGELYRVYGIDKAYPNLVRVPEKIYDMNVIVISRDDAHAIRGWSDLQSKTVAYLRGFLYAEKQLKGSGVVPVDQLGQAISMLHERKVAYVVSTRVTSVINLFFSERKGVRIQEEFRDYVPLYHYIHVESKRWVPLISKSLQEMRETGVTDAIIESFIQLKLAPPPH